MDAESCHILADREHMKILEKERTQHNGKINKERAGQCAVFANSHKKWIETLARNLSTQRKASEKDQKKESEKMHKKLEVVDLEMTDERRFNQDR